MNSWNPEPDASDPGQPGSAGQSSWQQQPTTSWSPEASPGWSGASSSSPQDWSPPPAAGLPPQAWSPPPAAGLPPQGQYPPQQPAPPYGQQPFQPPAYGVQPYGIQPPPGYGPGYQLQPGQPPAMYVAPKSPAVAVIASLFVPGLGSMISGQVGKGVVILVSYFVSLVLIAVIIGWIAAPAVWIWGMVAGYLDAQKWNQDHGIIS
jgi:TM2 domain-containing membrane protein YozV